MYNLFYLLRRKARTDIKTLQEKKPKENIK